MQQISIPDDAFADLEALAADLGLSAGDLVTAYVRRGVHEADYRRSRFLAEIEDHSRITGWMPDGSPRMKP